MNENIKIKYSSILWLFKIYIIHTRIDHFECDVFNILRIYTYLALSIRSDTRLVLKNNEAT